MKQYSAAYSSKVHLATALAELNVRAVTITAVARTKPTDSREIFKRIQHTQSDSGQTPTAHNWFLQSKSRRLHGAALLIMYAKYRTAYDHLPDAHGIAFTLTLRLYNKMCDGDMLVRPERLNLLIGHGFLLGWKKILTGGTSAFAFENVKLVKCRKCKLPHLAEAHYLNYECEDCATSNK